LSDGPCWKSREVSIRMSGEIVRNIKAGGLDTKKEPQVIIIPLSVLREMPDAFEVACKLCEIDPNQTELKVII
jgi:hypothetical protein